MDLNWGKLLDLLRTSEKMTDPRILHAKAGLLANVLDYWAWLIESRSGDLLMVDDLRHNLIRLRSATEKLKHITDPVQAVQESEQLFAIFSEFTTPKTSNRMN